LQSIHRGSPGTRQRFGDCSSRCTTNTLNVGRLIIWADEGWRNEHETRLAFPVPLVKIRLCGETK
jgi:hypothetical protein